MLHFIQNTEFDLRKTLTTFELWMWCGIAHLQCPLICIFHIATSEISVVIVSLDLCLFSLAEESNVVNFIVK